MKEKNEFEIVKIEKSIIKDKIKCWPFIIVNGLLGALLFGMSYEKLMQSNYYEAILALGGAIGLGIGNYYIGSYFGKTIDGKEKQIKKLIHN